VNPSHFAALFDHRCNARVALDLASVAETSAVGAERGCQSRGEHRLDLFIQSMGQSDLRMHVHRPDRNDARVGGDGNGAEDLRV